MTSPTRRSPSRPESATPSTSRSVLLADHELAASTLAARVAASARSDPYGVVLAGLGPLSGPLHGGAPLLAAQLLRAAAESGPDAALARALDVHGRVPGFGHPLYLDGDPKARVLLELLRRASPGRGLECR